MPRCEDGPTPQISFGPYPIQIMSKTIRIMSGTPKRAIESRTNPGAMSISPLGDFSFLSSLYTIDRAKIVPSVYGVVPLRKTEILSRIGKDSHIFCKTRNVGDGSPLFSYSSILGQWRKPCSFRMMGRKEQTAMRHVAFVSQGICVVLGVLFVWTQPEPVWAQQEEVLANGTSL